LNGAKRLNDWNAWNGPIPVMNGAKRLNDWNVWNELSVTIFAPYLAFAQLTIQQGFFFIYTNHAALPSLKQQEFRIVRIAAKLWHELCVTFGQT
jgi:hypothetical protein